MSIGQIFFKKLGFLDKIFSIIFYYDSEHNNLFASEAFVVIGEKNVLTKDLLLFFMFNF